MHPPVHLLDYAADLTKAAKAAGADAADAMAAESMSTNAAFRQGGLTDLERSETTEIGLRVLVGKRQASLATSKIDPKNFSHLAEQAISMAKAAPEDPYAGLAEAGQYATAFPECELFDSTEIPAETLIENARTMDGLAGNHPLISNVEEAAASTGSSGFAFVTSNGFSGGYKRSSHGYSLVTIAGKDTNMVRDYDYTQAIYAADLRAVEDVAHVAITRTVSRLDARKMGTAAVPVVFSTRVARSLVSTLLSAISGQAVARKSTFLASCMGEEIFAPSITISDDPTRLRGFRSKPFDGEGLPVCKRNLIEKGVLTTWLLNCAAARQLNLQSTGHASRGVGGTPSIAAHNVALEAGTLSPEDLIRDIQSGFFVTETMGFGVNTLTGDYSQGAAGFWIENGQIVFPVHEMTIAGNLKDMFRNLTPANDLVYRYGVDAPTTRIDGMMVAGA